MRKGFLTLRFEILNHKGLGPKGFFILQAYNIGWFIITIICICVLALVNAGVFKLFIASVMLLVVFIVTLFVLFSEGFCVLHCVSLYVY